MRIDSFALIVSAVIITSVALMGWRADAIGNTAIEIFHQKEIMRIACYNATDTLRSSAEVYGQTYSMTHDINPKDSIEAFFTSLCCNLSATTPESRAELMLRVPLIVIFDDDGVYIDTVAPVLQEDYNSKLHKHFCRVTLPKIPYYFMHNNRRYYMSTHDNINLLEFDDGIQKFISVNSVGLNIEECWEKVYRVLALQIEQVVNQYENYGMNSQVLNMGFTEQINKSFIVNLNMSRNVSTSKKLDMGFLAVIATGQSSGICTYSDWCYQRVGVLDKKLIYGFISEEGKFYCKDKLFHGNQIKDQVVFIDTRQAAEHGYFPCQACFIQK